ncbi:tetratricopeptide repeat protein [Bradyrhizobium sp. STM 3561]|uniref:tetratricopeptide repeat protein n=1 Tax=Bradyrhizobium sp. STM 3561 TaxID=578923 RepID=UPI00388DDB4A
MKARIFMQKRLFSGLIAAALLWTATETLAEDGAKWRCTGQPDIAPDIQIDGCTAAIRSGQYSGKNLAWAYFNRGNAYQTKEDYDRAIADYDQAIALAPDAEGPFANRGIVHRKKQEYDQAIADLTRAIALGGKDGLVYFNRAEAYNGTGDHDRAIADLDRAIALEPKSAGNYVGRGVAYYNKKDYDRAIADFNRAIAMDPKFGGAYYFRASAFNAKKDFDSAIADYSQVIVLHPKSTDAYSERGDVYFGKGDYDRAIADYGQAIGLDPKTANVYANRSSAYRKMNEHGLAMADLNQAIALDPKPAYLKARGVFQFELGDFKASATDLLRVLETNDSAYVMLFRYLARARAGEAAASELEGNARRLNDKSWPFPVIELLAGKRSPEATLAAATKQEETCEANFYIGESYILSAKKELAQKALRAAADTCPKSFVEFNVALAELKRF